MEAGQEAVVLLLLATGCRVDDEHKLGRDFDVYHSGIRLHSRTLRKCPKKRTRIESFLLKKFDEDRLCPVQVIQHYLDVSDQARSESARALFISSKGDDAAIETLKHWVSTLLELAGINASPGSCRSAAASKAFEENFSVDKIMDSAGWASEILFANFTSAMFCPNVLSLLTAESDSPVLSVAPLFSLILGVQ